MTKLFQTKRCSKCKQIKLISEFNQNKSRKDGLQHSCKFCQATYAQTDRGRIVIQNAQKSYRQTQKGKISAREGMKRYKFRHPDRRKAKAAVNSAVANGKLPHISTLLCHCCFGQAQQYHHHRGYEPKHRLDVVSICTKCHKKIHQKKAERHDFAPKDKAEGIRAIGE